ncbi:PAS domain S-box-containing protein [Alkalibacterium subtropicum]|uniref:histidine kinase n=1 Tax=Alkalibacterium subtropicum TaxID=753702 RepID=A0A1I1IGY3_9LACT|nr:ATP-binding protein [Alkalibacterium subtropicum]SFC33023.1 PAS domain S-box-containing protein [Alkalibacterium subtropicum]
MSDKTYRPIKIKRKFYRMAALLLSVIVLITTLGIITLLNVQSTIDERYEETTMKFNAINDLEDNLTQVLFRARGYYAFQDQMELNLLYENLEEFRDSIDHFQSLSLTDEEEELNTILSDFYTNYTNTLLPSAISYVEADDYESLRALSSGGTNEDINRFLQYTRGFNDESQLERDEIYADTLLLINRFTTGFIILGLVSFGLFVFVISRLLKEIIFPLEMLISATLNLKKGKKLELKSDFQLQELQMLAQSFEDMATEVQDKEDELTAQNEELLSQQDELEYNQNQLEAYVTEIEHINKALNQSALLCITNDEGIIINVNDMFCRTSKYKEDELVGNTTRILKSGHQDKAFYETMWHTISKGKIWTGKIRNEAKDGSCYWLNATIVPFLNEKGKAYRYILIGIDITENKRNEHALKELLEQTQKAKEKTEKYSNLNKELTATVNRDEFLNRVFGYFRVAFDFDKGILVSPNQKQFAEKGLTENHARQFLSDAYLNDIVIRLQDERFYIVKREANESEIGIAEGKVYSYDLYASVKDEHGNIALIFALTRIGNVFADEEISEILILMGQLSIALSRIDIYEDVQRERSLNESIVQNVTEGLQLVSLDGDLLQANDKLLQMIGMESYRDNKIVSKDIWIQDFAKKCQESAEIRAFFEQAIDSEYSDISSIRCQLDDETTRHLQIYTSPVFIDEAKTGTIFMYRDITREYEIDVMKSELVSTVSHELRTPLSSVLGFTEMLLMKELKPEKQKRYLETIFKEAKRLTNLINDFLDVQRIESGKQEYEMKEVNLNKTIMEVIDTFKHEKNNPIYLEDSASFTHVMADRERLIQLLTNIISNAVKFSPEGGKVAVKIYNENGKIVVSISDQGIGIPKADIGTIFTKFKRVDNSASKKIGGTGLGLAISKGIIEAHQGDIWIDSQENHGTTVFFSLPVLHAPTDQMQSAKPEGVFPESKGTVLLIEDDISLAMMLSESLKFNGFNVIHYLNSRNVSSIAQERTLTAIVVDLMLEDGMTGWDLIEEIQSGETTRTIPVIVSSAIDKKADALDRYQIHDYLVKPYSPEILSEILLKLIED